MHTVFFQLIGFWFLVVACKSNPNECAFQPETDHLKIDLTIELLQDSVTNFKTKEQLVRFFDTHSVLRELFFNRPQYPNDSIFINELYRRFNNPSFDTLLMETHRVFGDCSELRNSFSKAFANFKYYYPDFKIPKIQTVITGLESELMVSDTLIVIGLDYFLGNSAKYRPNMYQYMLTRYTKEFVVPSVMLLYGIDGRINHVDSQDKTVLADMIAYGKAYYFAKQMLPCTPDSIFIGYSALEIEGARANQDIIWKRMIKDEVFFNTTRQIKQKYISERPKTIEVSDQCPGRIGMWVGWQIVNSFVKKTHSTITAQQSLPLLMQHSDAQQIFKMSHYRPK